MNKKLIKGVLDGAVYMVAGVMIVIASITGNSAIKAKEAAATATDLIERAMDDNFDNDPTLEEISAAVSAVVPKVGELINELASKPQPETPIEVEENEE